jgi:hypothetical protein
MFRSRTGWTILASLAAAAILPNAAQSQTPVPLAPTILTPVPFKASASITKVYSLAGFGSDAQLGPWIAETATEIIQPATWKINGGGGVIRYSASSRILAVSNSPAVHNEFETFLQNVKRALPGAKDSGVTQAQLTVPNLQPVPTTSSKNQSPNYAVPAPLQQPKHLFHFIIRYEGEGVVDENVVEFLKNSTRSSSPATPSLTIPEGTIIPPVVPAPAPESLPPPLGSSAAKQNRNDAVGADSALQPSIIPAAAREFETIKVLPIREAPPDNAKPEAPAEKKISALRQLFNFIVRYEGDGIIDANIVELMRTYAAGQRSSPDAIATSP